MISGKKITSHFYCRSPPVIGAQAEDGCVWMLRSGRWGRGQEGEKKAQGQSKPSLWFPVCPEKGDFPSCRARALLITCYSLWITISLINNGCAPHNRKDPMLFGNKKFQKGTVGSLLSELRYRWKIEKSIKIILQTLRYLNKQTKKEVKITPDYIMHLKTLTVLRVCRMFTERWERSLLFTELPHSRKICDYLSSLTAPVCKGCVFWAHKREGHPVSPMRYCVGGKLSLSQITVLQWSALHDLWENESRSIKSMRTACIYL